MLLWTNLLNRSQTDSTWTIYRNNRRKKLKPKGCLPTSTKARSKSRYRILSTKPMSSRWLPSKIMQIHNFRCRRCLTTNLTESKFLWISLRWCSSKTKRPLLRKRWPQSAPWEDHQVQSYQASTHSTNSRPRVPRAHSSSTNLNRHPCSLKTQPRGSNPVQTSTSSTTRVFHRLDISKQVLLWLSQRYRASKHHKT